MLERRQDIIEQKSLIKNLIKQHQSKAFICKELKCKPITLERYLKILGIKYSGNKGLKGIKVSTRKLSAFVYMNSNKFINSHILKLKLLKEKIKEHRCEKCKNSIWLNKSIPLELHHIDGDNKNNKLENLKLYCPNCHALEDNNSGRANKK
ncbi:MAG: hypothetical protein WC940_02825 [Candidatus Paceibacterota bacterium]|jgi:Zn finger protein HypA/HybF involved in hydrogenase expression